MKNKFLILLILAVVAILMGSFVFADSNGSEKGNVTNQTNGNQNQNQNQGNETQNQEQEQEEEGNITRVRNRTEMKFIPWQKRNESECLEGCKCVGAVMSCPTENGKIMTIEAGRSGNIITITIVKNKTNEEEANTTLELEAEEGNQTKLHVQLSNGRKAEIKIMPDVAAERARERLGELGFAIELKEVGKQGEEQLAYEFEGEKPAKILGLFRKQARVTAEINAENGEVIKVGRPWWAFLASGV